MSHRRLDPEGDIPSALPALNRLLRTEGAAVEEIAEHAAALAEAESHYHAVPVLLRLSRHKSPVVRCGAVTGMAGHDVPAVVKRLAELARDRDKSVRTAVKKTEAALFALPVLCANGCEEPATLRAEPSSDPHGPVETEIFPVFCGQACAVAWAMDQFRDAVRGGAMHLCLVERTWMAGSSDECSDCEEATLLGEDSDVDE